MHTDWSRFCTLNPWVWISNCQLSHMGLGDKLMTSEMRIECVNHYTIKLQVLRYQMCNVVGNGSPNHSSVSSSAGTGFTNGLKS